MGFILPDSYWVDVLLWTITALGVLYHWATANHTYWQTHGVRTVSKISPIFGSIADAFLMRRQQGLLFEDFYKELEGEKYGGYYNMRKPALLIRDPAFIKQVLVKDFHYFMNNDFHANEKLEPLLAFNIFALKGGKWKYARSKISPAFSTGKIRTMCPLIFDVTKELVNNLQLKIENKNTEFEAKSLAANFTTDVVGSCAFAVKCNSLKDENNEFRKMGKEMLNPSFKIALAFMLRSFVPSIAEFIGIRFTSERVENFFRGLVTDAFKVRETQGITRNDFIQLLMQLKQEGKVREDTQDLVKNETDSNLDTVQYEKVKFDLTHDFLAAQALGFFADGFETSSVTLSFAMHELVVNPDAQNKLRKELRMSVENNGGELNYEVLKNCYLDQVIMETLRKYPPAQFMNKICTKKYQLPNSNVTLKVGTKVTIPIQALHHDPKYFPEPEIFDPDRFSEERKKDIVPFSFLPFSEGPRQCIGMRFGLTQVKAALASIILNFELLPSKKTTHPVKLNPQHFMPIALKGLHMTVAPLPR